MIKNIILLFKDMADDNLSFRVYDTKPKAPFKWLLRWNADTNTWHRPEGATDWSVINSKYNSPEACSKEPFTCVGRCGRKAVHSEMSEPQGDYVFYFRKCGHDLCIRRGMDHIYFKMCELYDQGENVPNPRR